MLWSQSESVLTVCLDLVSELGDDEGNHLLHEKHEIASSLTLKAGDRRHERVQDPYTIEKESLAALEATTDATVSEWGSFSAHLDLLDLGLVIVQCLDGFGAGRCKGFKRV